MTSPHVGGSAGAAIAAAIGMVLLIVGCGAEQPTEVPDQLPASATPVIRGFSNGCVPEVIESSAEGTDTVLVTFNALDNSCLPNLVQWGIDMADPVGVDTPQGNNYFRVTSDNMANMPPSPSLSGLPARAARIVSYTPPQVVIEFDPPVQTVEFHYSRLANERAMWNGQMVQADSMRVSAMSREPGTLFYETYDSKVLHSNVPSTSPPWSAWTPVRLSANGDKIQWLWFDGGLAIDNLKITRTPLACTPSVERGGEVACVVSSSSWNVTNWEFIPDASAQLSPVQEGSASRQWKGTAAVGGVVRAYVTNGSAQRTLQARFSVSDRASRWRSMWSYRQGPELTVADREPDTTGSFGRNCAERFAVESLCIARPPRSRVQPDPYLETGAGYDAAAISSGPNKGYWYVAAVRYDMKRVANVNPGILVTSPRKHLVPAAALTKKCRQRLGAGPKVTLVYANMNQFNQYCGPNGTDMAVFVPAIWGHEGFGYNGGKGHETLAREAAGEPQNDPYAAIERLAYLDASSLANEVNLLVRVIADDITGRSGDENAVNGGPQGNYTNPNNNEMWLWRPDSTWRRYPLLRDY